MNAENFCRFFGKPSKSILSVAQCVPPRERWNGLARFLNKMADLTHPYGSFYTSFDNSGGHSKEKINPINNF